MGSSKNKFQDSPPLASQWPSVGCLGLETPAQVLSPHPRPGPGGVAFLGPTAMGASLPGASLL